MRNKDVDSSSLSGSEPKSKANRLRLLDFDDLFLLSHLLEGSTIAATAKQLGLTQPAITQRVRKIERVFAEPILQKAGRHVRLTKEGRAVCLKAADALALMRDVATESQTPALTIGTLPGLSDGWLFPVISEFREQDPKTLLHCTIGPIEELFSLLETAQIDACFVAAAAPNGMFGSIDVVEEEFLMVARGDLAREITSVADLERFLFLEVDRSCPSLQRIAAQTRASLRFAGAWFLGTETNVMLAALAGQGVGVLPSSAVRSALAVGKLSIVLSDLDLSSERFRLIYRKERGTEVLLQRIVERLKSRKGR